MVVTIPVTILAVAMLEVVLLRVAIVPTPVIFPLRAVNSSKTKSSLTYKSPPI